MYLAASPGLYLGLGGAIVAAIVFGVADFGAAQIGRKITPQLLLATLYIFEIPLLAIASIASHQFGHPKAGLALLGIGTIGTISYTFIVYALSRGHVSVVITLSGLFGLLVPAIVSVVIGEKSSWLIWAGVIVAAIAIVCVTQSPIPEHEEILGAHGRALKLSVIVGIGSGIGFGIYFAGLGHIDSPIPIKLFLLQVTGFIASIIYVIIKRPNAAPVKKNILILMGMSFAYNIGQFLFPFAASRTSLVVANIIVNLYPGITIGMSKIFVGEKTSRTQNIGFAVAIAGLVLVSLGVGT